MLPLRQWHRAMIESSLLCNVDPAHARRIESCLARHLRSGCAASSQCATSISIIDDLYQYSYRSTDAWFALNRHLATGIPNNGASNRQSQSISVVLCREERFLDAGHMFERNSAAGVSDDDFQLLFETLCFDV